MSQIENDPLGVGLPGDLVGAAQQGPQHLGPIAPVPDLSRSRGRGGHQFASDGGTSTWGSSPAGGYADVDAVELYNLPPEELARVQRKMAAAGLLSDGGYLAGQPDRNTVQAFTHLLELSNARSTMWQPMLDDLARGGKDAAKAAEREAADRKRLDLEASFSTDLHLYDRSDPASVRMSLRSAFEQALGRKPTDTEMTKFVDSYLAEEERSQRSVFDAQDQMSLDDRQRKRNALAVGGEVDTQTFLDALSGQESGGNASAVNARTGAYGRFQIMPQNWSAWAKEAGLGADAPRTARNQEEVARFKVEQYKQQFGSWEAVAVAWYAGPSAARDWLKDPNSSRFNRKQGNGNEPSVNDYVRSVTGRLGTPDSGSESDRLWNALQQMAADAPGKVTFGARTRSYEEQVRLYNLYKSGKGALAARPGTSKHSDGRANDLKYENQATKRWVLENAHRYGLSFPLLSRGEDWHVELAPGAGGAAGSSAPISRSLTQQRQDLGARSYEYARNSNPTEAAAYDIGSQFKTLLGLLNGGAGL